MKVRLVRKRTIVEEKTIEVPGDVVPDCYHPDTQGNFMSPDGWNTLKSELHGTIEPPILTGKFVSEEEAGQRDML